MIEVKLESWQRVMMAVNHKESDRVPFDLGGTESSSISLKAYQILRRHLGLPEKDVPVENMMALFETLREYGVY